jgi:hypothetical protein
MSETFNAPFAQPAVSFRRLVFGSAKQVSRCVEAVSWDAKDVSGYAKDASDCAEPRSGYLKPETGYAKPVSHYSKPVSPCAKPVSHYSKPVSGSLKLASNYAKPEASGLPFGIYLAGNRAKSIHAVVSALLFLAFVFPAFAQTKVSLLSNGSPTNRLNLTLLSEGYQNSEEAQFLTDASNVVNYFLAAEPYHEYRSYFNASAIFVASVDTGSDKPDAPKDTYFNSSYDGNIITIPLDTNGLGKVNALLNTFAPETDLKILIVNDTQYGGAGGPILITSTHILARDIVVHESGHTLAGLGDEYANPFPGFPDTEEPNTTRETDRDLIKWKSWISPSTPIPTPATEDYEDQVGLFEGAHYHSVGWFRPQQFCTMHSLEDGGFCAVCTEALVKAIYKRVHLVETFSPATKNFSIGAAQTVDFQVSTVQPATHNLSAQWFTNGIPIADATNLTFELATFALTKGTYSVRAEIRDTTPLVRNDPENSLSNSVTWRVTKSFSPPPPYDAEKGKYSGLFFETNEVRLASSGLFTLNLAGSGAFSGKLVMPDKTSSFKGSFISNHADVVVLPRNQTSLQINLDLDPAQLQMHGQISDSNWTADLLANRDSTNGALTKYTFLVPGQDAANSPPGNSFGSAVLRPGGFLQASGWLSDGTRFQFRTRGSSAREFPFFVRLYGGGGMVLSWLHLTDEVIGDDPIDWIKASGARGKFYPEGFTNVSLLSGDRYDAPLPKTPAVNWTNAVMILSGGNLFAPSTNEAVLTNNTFTFAETNKVSLAIIPATGLLKGKFLHPATQRMTVIQGAILQKRNIGGGFFSGTNETGAMSLEEISAP